MDKSQYHFPKTEHSAELYTTSSERALQSSPERAPAPFQGIKDIEALIDSFRDTAEAIEYTKGREVKLKYMPISFVRPARSHQEIRRHLIDTERVIGGQLFAQKNTYYFWYGEKNETVPREPGVADWYIEEITPGSSNPNIVTHLETHPQYVKKFNHAGQPVPVTLSDLEIFIPATYHYVRAIMEAYPFEKDRAEVLLDSLDDPRDILALLMPTQDEPPHSGYDQAA